MVGNWRHLKPRTKAFLLIILESYIKFQNTATTQQLCPLFFFFGELLKDQFKSQKGKPVPGLNDHSFFSMKSFKKGIRYNGGPEKLTQPRSHSFLILETKIKVNAGSYSLFTRIGSNFSVSSDKIQSFFFFFFLASLLGLQDLNSLTKGWIQAVDSSHSAVKVLSLNPWTTTEFPKFSL